MNYFRKEKYILIFQLLFLEKPYVLQSIPYIKTRTQKKKESNEENKDSEEEPYTKKSRQRDLK